MEWKVHPYDKLILFQYHQYSNAFRYEKQSIQPLCLFLLEKREESEEEKVHPYFI